MTAPTHDARHRAVEVIERHLRDEDVYGAAQLARSIVARVEAAGLAITDAPARGPTTGFCTDHGSPHPCHGCAADRKAAPDHDTERP